MKRYKYFVSKPNQTKAIKANFAWAAFFNELLGSFCCQCLVYYTQPLGCHEVIVEFIFECLCFIPPGNPLSFPLRGGLPKTVV